MESPRLTREDLLARLEEAFPEAFNAESGVEIDRVWHGGCAVRQRYRAHSLRPGGTISGPTMMALADVALYVALLASIGWQPLAVTTQLNINFLRKPAPADLLAEAQLFKIGRRLVVGEVGIRSEGNEALVAHATGTYSVPEGESGIG